MKFSVLIPTRDRLDLLKQAIDTVRTQDYDDWEIIVSDNASVEDVRTYLDEIGDPRIRYSRTTSSVPVTDNWNRALEMSTGHYIVMLGDDDALLPGYFRINRQVIEHFRCPEALFVQGVQFVYSGVIPGHPKAFVQVANCEFIGQETEPFPLRHDVALGMVQKSATFKVTFPFNMQYWLLSRELVVRMTRQGPFFQSPYPDYYAANSILLEAKSIVVQPLPLVAVGITPKSFGFYYFNKREAEGVAFLQNDNRSAEAPIDRVILPGSNMNTSWLLAMEALWTNWGQRHGIRVDHWRYRFLQIRHAYVNRTSFAAFLAFLIKHGRPPEIALWLCLHLAIAIRSIGRRRHVKAIKTDLTLDVVHCAYPKVRIFTKEVQASDLRRFYKTFEPVTFMREVHGALHDGRARAG